MQRKLLMSLLLSLLPLVLFFFAVPARASTIINVNSTLDAINSTDGNCTLREAIIAANTNAASGGVDGECPAGSGADTIIIPAGIYTLSVGGVAEDNSATGDLDIKQNVTIRGNGGACLFYPTTCTQINAANFDRVIDITTTVQVTMSGLDINWGYEGSSWGGGGIRNFGVLRLNDAYLGFNYSSGGGGGILNEEGATATLDQVGFLLNSSNNGGAIYNQGVMTLTRTLFNLDGAVSSGGGIYNYYQGTVFIADSGLGGETAGTNGGGIFNGGNMTLDRVLLSTNKATSGNGGGINSSGSVTLTNVTLSSNIVSTTLAAQGGAIYFGGSDSALTNVTIYNNTAASGAGIYNNAPVWIVYSLKNTILYSNTTSNCAGNAITSLGYNIDGANTCAFAASGDLPNTNPLLGPLQYNGGWHPLFQTHALAPTSPAINSGTSVGCPATDARNFMRVGGCDRGAFEYVLRVFLPLIKR